MTKPSPDERPIHPAREEFGSIKDAVRVDVELTGPPAGEFTVRFEGDHLERLLYGIRELGIQPLSEFFRDAALAAIDGREAELAAAKKGADAAAGGAG